MKIKKIKVEIKPLERVLNEAKNVMKDLAKGKKVEPKEGVGFHSVSEFRTFFTEKRLEILKVLKEYKPRSVYALAKLLKRDIKSVHVDLKILEEHGMIEMKKNERTVRPYHNYDKVTIEMVL